MTNKSNGERSDGLARIGKVVGLITLPIAIVCWLILLGSRLVGQGSPTYGKLLLFAGLPLSLCMYAGIVGAVLCVLSLMRKSGKDAVFGLVANLITFALGVSNVLLL